MAIPTAKVVLAFTNYYPDNRQSTDGCVQRYADNVERHNMGGISHVEIWLPKVTQALTVDENAGLWYSCTQLEGVRGVVSIVHGDAKYKFFRADIPVDEVLRMRAFAESMCGQAHDQDAMIAAGVRYWHWWIPVFTCFWVSKGACCSQSDGYFCSKFVHDILSQSAMLMREANGTGELPTSSRYTIPVHLFNMVTSQAQQMWHVSVNTTTERILSASLVNRFSFSSETAGNNMIATDPRSTFRRIEIRKERERKREEQQSQPNSSAASDWSLIAGLRRFANFSQSADGDALQTSPPNVDAMMATSGSSQPSLTQVYNITPKSTTITTSYPVYSSPRASPSVQLARPMTSIERMHFIDTQMPLYNPTLRPLAKSSLLLENGN